MATTACVALGSNLGEPAVTLEKAAGRMDGIIPGVRLAACSRIWLTAPQAIERMELPLPEALRERAGGQGAATDPWYANMAARLECGPYVSPETLFEALMCLEAELGRDRTMESRWGPRVIDIDLLTFGDETRNSAKLTLPHPRMLERAFVVFPLAEVAPELVPPEILKRLSFSVSGTMIF